VSTPVTIRLISVNAVERVLWYTDPNSVPQEAAHEIPESDPPKTWPSTGAISMEKIVMSYRPGLPAVLKGISLDIKSGEKVGIIGRTGAGKTSITVALYRLAELTSGTIKVDGVDVSKIGLHTLRSRIAIIPQDPVLFSGTLRSNLDPFDLYSDERLYDAMKRACITDSTVGGEGREVKRFTLDTVVEDEGLNLSECST
jgi:ATP-binding cassette subfamily C (CFTR/MRP) protein 1